MKDDGKKEEHLPIFGVGPLYGTVVFLLTAGAVWCRDLPIFSFGKIDALSTPMMILGILLLLAGLCLWAYAAVFSGMLEGIKTNHLVTTGIYACVRNPLYCGLTMAHSGVLFMTGNVLFLVLPFLFCLFMTILMIHTEEKWLHDLYGEEYEEYCKRVNRCIPWFPKKAEAVKTD